LTKRYLDGLEDAEATLRIMPEKVRKQMVRGLNRWRLEAEKRAAALAKGSVAENVGSDIGRTDGGDGIVARIYVDDFRAGWIEFGTQPHSLTRGANVQKGKGQSDGPQHPGSAAQPFFWPAIRGVRRRMRANLMRSLKRAAKEIRNDRR